jgi:four helix bundle protein
MPVKRFEDLEIWQRACDLAVQVYRLTEENEGLKRDYGLKDQIRRAAVSIGSNIAEGFERGSKREFIHFLYTAKGSAGELRTQLRILKGISYISPEEFEPLLREVVSLSKQIARFINYLEEDLRKEETGS